MILNKCCYLPSEPIIGSVLITKYPDIERIDISIQMCKVYDWYDASFNMKVEATVSNNVLSFILPNSFDKGLYAVISITIKDTVVYGKANDNENCETVFLISEKSINALSLYRKILKERDSYISKPKFRIEDKSVSSYDVFLFIKNLDISYNAYYDTIQVYPYDYLRCTSEIEYINEFIQKNTNINIVVNQEYFEKLVPSAVFVINNIMAYDYEEAEIRYNIFRKLKKDRAKV